MKKSDWIILRLIMQIEVIEKGLEGDATEAVKFLIKKYGNKKIESCMKAIKKDRNYQKYVFEYRFFKFAENYLKEKS